MAGWLVLAALMTTGTLTVTSGTASACSCLGRDLSEYADDVSVAFVGTQLEKVVHDYVGDNGAALLFSVDRVYVGEAGPLIEVRTHAQGDAACGIDMDGRGQVGIAAFDWRGANSVNWCSSIVTQAELESLFGEGLPPAESTRLAVSPDPAEDFSNIGAPPSVASDEHQQAAQSTGDTDTDTDNDKSLPAIVLVAVTAAGLAGIVIVWRLRR